MIVSSLTPAAWAALRALSTTFFMSCGAMNCAFLMFTGLPDAATAWMKSVWRARKAGVCSTSTTSATGSICGMSWTSVRIGTPSSSRTFSRIRSPSSMPGPAKALVRRAIGLVEARLEDEEDAELVGDAPSAARRCAAEALRFRPRTGRRSGRRADRARSCVRVIAWRAFSASQSTTATGCQSPRPLR